MTAAAATRVLVIGKESVGKSQLVAALTGARAKSANFRGTTVACEEYRGHGLELVDTPGLHRASDSVAVRETLSRLEHHDRVLVVAKATHLDEDLDDLLPLVQGRRVAVAVTFWDRVAATGATTEAIRRLSAGIGLPVVPLDARRCEDDRRRHLRSAIEEAPVAVVARSPVRVGWRVEPRPTWLEHRRLGPLLGMLLLVLPAVLAVWAATAVAGLLDPLVGALLEPLAERGARLPGGLAAVAAGDYGLLTMGPLLFVWAVPTVAVYALVQGAYKTSGLLDRISTAVHPLTRPFGLSGRDVTRVLMGFGCNVPAVVSTRTCSGCSRPPTVGAIAFGSACSYQLGATLAVFAAAGRSALVWPFLLYLVVTTLVYVRLTSPAPARSPLNILVVERRSFLTWPPVGSTLREMSGILEEFFRKALPIFLAITVVASLVEWLGLLSAGAAALEPAMGAFRLPGEAALPVVFASVRKDGILLFDEPGLLETLSGPELLTGVYLAGVLLPCVVTALTIGRELGPAVAAKMAGRQAGFAIAFAALLAWGAAAAGQMIEAR